MYGRVIAKRASEGWRARLVQLHGEQACRAGEAWLLARMVGMGMSCACRGLMGFVVLAWWGCLGRRGLWQLVLHVDGVVGC